MSKKSRNKDYNDWIGGFACRSFDSCYQHFDELTFQCVMFIIEVFASKGVEISQDQAEKIVKHGGGVSIAMPFQIGRGQCSLLKASKADLETILDGAEGRPVNVLE